MNDPVKKELFKEIVSELNDFYLTQACDFIEGLRKPESWYKLPASQVKQLQDTFVKADEESARKKTDCNKTRKEALAKFLSGQNERQRGQAEKEKRKGGEPLWQHLLENSKNLLAFLFPQDEKFFDEKFFTDLRNQAEKLTSMRGQQYPDRIDIDDYLTPAGDEKPALRRWQYHELLPIITEKLLHTLITLHRLHNAECYQEKARKEWLPC